MSYKKHRDADERRHSAITAIKGILRLRILPSHQRLFLSIAIWKLTEADGVSKYKTQYRSLASRKEEKNGTRLLRHEHVFLRGKLVDDFIAHPKEVDRIAKRAVACVVTKKEHDRLERIDRQFPNLDGWERYKRAKIIVIDIDGERKVALDKLIRATDHV